MLSCWHLPLESLIRLEEDTDDLRLERIFVHGGEAWLHIVTFYASLAVIVFDHINLFLVLFEAFERPRRSLLPATTLKRDEAITFAR